MSWGEVKYAINNSLGTDKFKTINQQIEYRPLEIKSGFFNTLDKDKYVSEISTHYDTSPTAYKGMNTDTDFYLVHYYTGSSYDYYYLTKYNVESQSVMTAYSEKDDSSSVLNKITDWFFNKDDGILYVLISGTMIRKITDLKTTIITLPEQATIFYVKDMFVFYMSSAKFKKFDRIEGKAEEIKTITAAKGTGTSTHCHWPYGSFWYFIGTNGNIYKINLTNYDTITISASIADYGILTDYERSTVLIHTGSSISKEFDCKTDTMYSNSYSIAIPNLDPNEKINEKQVDSSDPRGFVKGNLIITNKMTRSTTSYLYGYHRLRSWQIDQFILGNRKVLFLKKGLKVRTFGNILIYNASTMQLDKVILADGVYIANGDVYLVDDGQWLNIEEE
jgi:hypothetical protein